MRNFIFSLLILTSTLLQGQTIIVEHGWINLPQNIKVGDTVTYYQSIVDQSGTVDLQYIQVDISYNHNKLTKIQEPVWDQRWSQDSKATNHWFGYYYDGSYYGSPIEDLSLQVAEGLGGKYSGNNNWNIQRTNIQSVQDIDGLLFTQQFTVSDIDGTQELDYLDVINFNWSFGRDRQNITIQQITGNQHSLDLENVSGIPAGMVTFQLQSPNNNNATDYIIQIYDELEEVDTNNDGIIDMKVPSMSPPVISTRLDGSGKLVTNSLKQDTEYFIEIFVEGTYDQQSSTVTYPDWLDDAVTVSDVLLAFLQANGGGLEGQDNILEYDIQEQLGNVSQDIKNAGGEAYQIDTDDSYALLAFLTGVMESQSNNSSKFYPITSVTNGPFNVSALLDYWGKNDSNRVSYSDSKIFTLTDNNPVTFNLAHGLMGDIDLSHSTTPALDQSTVIIRSQAFPGFNTRSIASLQPVETDLDIFTEKVGNKVVMKVDITKTDLSGLQLNMQYDTDKLVFENVTFDTGNSMTNFAKEKDGILIVGSIDPNGNSVITPGKILELTFDTKESITNTAGLVSFRITDAVQQDGRKVNLKIK